MRIKKFLSVMLAVALLFSVIPITVTASAETVTSGTTGDCTWTLDGTHLTIGGNGKMGDFLFIDIWEYDITSVTIEQGVTRIGDNAFAGCTGLTNITIPDGVTSMGRNAFYGCTSLTSITIPDSVTSISDDAFYNTAYYNNDNNWADGVLYIGNHLIKAKKDVVNGDYTIRQGTKCMARFAFSGCTGLTSITIPNSVTSIDVATFFGCENLKDVYYTGDLGDWCKVEFDGYYSNPMLYATNLYINGKLLEGEITIPDDITSIGDYTFHGCTSLTSITIPDSVTSIGDSAFSGCENLKDVYYTGDLSAWCKIKFGYDSNPMCYATNLYINGKLLEGEITIPDDITSIGDYTFHGCTSLTSITIPDSVTSIGALTFSGCTGLTGIVIPNSVTSIGGGAFSDCTGLTSITIPDSVTNIGDYAFDGCTNLTSITIPNSVTSIGGSAFLNTAYYNNDNNWADGVLYIGNHLINAKKDIVNGNYTIRQGTKCIASYAFSNCTGLTNVTIPDSVTSINYNAFRNCKIKELVIADGSKTVTSTMVICKDTLEKVVIPDSVTSIGNSAFSGCRNLTSITIPDSVTGIGDRAFSSCTGLTSVTIPDSVTSIGDSAFYGCTGLTGVTIPGSVTSMGREAFYCKNLKDVYYTGDLGDWCKIEFGYDSNPMCYATNLYINGKLLEGEITIPDDITSIGAYTFVGCSALTNITIPDSVTSIGSSAFRGCTGLTSIVIPDSVTYIGGGAFSDCTGLTSITIPNNVTSIGGYAFYGCTSLTSITIPDSVTSIDWDAFAGCKIKELKIADGSKTVTGTMVVCKNTLEKVTIPDSVTSIGDRTFQGCTGLTNITIGNGVTRIGDCAFYGCTGLTSITIPDSVTYIDSSAFRGCTGLTSIVIPDSVTYIGGGAFSDCTNLTTITVNQNNKYYSSVDGVLYNNKYKSELAAYPAGKKGEFTIPDSVTSIGWYAFDGCTGLTSITIPDSVTYIDRFAFSGCTGLTTITVDENNRNYHSVDGVLYNSDQSFLIKWPERKKGEFTIPDSVTSIGGGAFSGCTGLTGITIPDSVTSIGDGAFRECTSLTSVTIPDSVTSIGWGAFNDCTGLTAVTIGNSVTSIGGCAFQGCTGLTSIIIPDSVTSIDYGAFSCCTWLKSITIPDSVTSIGKSAFNSCTSLTSITIPNSVTIIGDWAFGGCNNLVIKTPENSAAHKYAVENNIKYELLEPVTVEGDDKNITISTDSSVIPSEGVSLSTEKVENIGEKYETQLKNLGAEKFTAYNIDLMKAGAKIQPDGKVTVSIAVPDGMDGAKCKVYRAESDGTLTDMKAVIENGKLTFTTDHFSLYIITQSAVKLGDVDGDGQITVKDAIAILRHNAEVELLTGSQIIAGDLNGDGSVNTKDAILLLQYNAQIIDKFPIE